MDNTCEDPIVLNHGELKHIERWDTMSARQTMLNLLIHQLVSPLKHQSQLGQPSRSSTHQHQHSLHKPSS